jgi:hypothetical protein
MVVKLFLKHPVFLGSRYPLSPLFANALSLLLVVPHPHTITAANIVCII